MTSSVQETGIEIWRHIPGYKAEASNHGRIKSFYQTDKGRIRKLQKGLRGKYLRVQLQNRGPYISVHRLVALAWHDNPMNLPIVNHKDGNGLNNSSSNLEWCDQSHNVNHANKNTVSRKWIRYTSLQKQVMREAFKAGHSKLSIGNYFGITDTTVRRIVS